MPDNDTAVLTEDDVIEALEEVIDPELGLDFVSLGLVYDVEIEKEEVFVTFTLTTPACPIGPQVTEQMKEFVGDLPGVTAVHPKMVFDPSWSPEMMTEDAKSALRFGARARCARGDPSRVSRDRAAYGPRTPSAGTERPGARSRRRGGSGR